MKLRIDFSNVEDKKKLYKVLMALKPKLHTVEIKQFRKKRSVNQNDYYHACIVAPLAAYLGYTHDEMHEVLKLQFLPTYKINRFTGEEIKIGRSTTGLTTVEFEIFAEQVRTWAITELDFLIALPNEWIEVS